MTFEEYRRHDALALAELVKKGEISAESLLEIAVARTEAINPSLNAVIHKLYDEGRTAARATDRSAPFAGVPFLVKDLGPEVAGAPKCTGSRGYRDYIPAEDSHVVRRMRAAGLVIFGKTNTPEFGLTPYTEPALFGPTRNPWNPAHSPGGSSGGSAAAVAAGIVPMATANDGGGSIRIPASCCGLFGLKPSRGRVSWSPGFGEMWSGAAVEGCVSRSVRDSAAYLDAISGAAPGEPYPFPDTQMPYLQEVSTASSKLRIGFSAQNTMGAATAPEALAALQKTVELLRTLGHEVEEVALPYQPEDLSEAFIVVVAAETAADLAQMRQHLRRPVRAADVEAETFGIHLLGKNYSAADYALAKRRWNDISRRIGAFHEQYDLFLTPTLPRAPIRIGELQSSTAERIALGIVNTLRLGAAMRATVASLAQKIYAYLPWTPFANMTGQPSMSVPLHWAEGDLPVGSMFTGRIGDEATLFRLAGQLEKTQPWWERVPA
jgi:amidase